MHKKAKHTVPTILLLGNRFPPRFSSRLLYWQMTAGKCLLVFSDTCRDSKSLSTDV